MNSANPRIIEKLMADYLDGSVSPEDESRLFKLLKNDPQRMEMLVDLVQLDNELRSFIRKKESNDAKVLLRQIEARLRTDPDLAGKITDRIEGKQVHLEKDETARHISSRCLRAHIQNQSRPQAYRGRQSLGFSWRAWAAAAACLAIIVGSVAYNARRSGTFEERFIAYVKAASPDVKIRRSGEFVVATVGVRLRAGDVVHTGMEQDLTFAYRGEDTFVAMAENTKLDLKAVEDGKKLHVDWGKIDVTAAGQPRGKPMVVTTQHAGARVKGTRFLLATDSKKTRIDVIEGEVLFTRTRDDNSVLVTEGRYVVTGMGIDLTVLPRTSPVRKDLPGKIVFQDDFEGGLDKWDIWSVNWDIVDGAGIARSRCLRVVLKAGGGVDAVFPRFKIRHKNFEFSYKWRFRTIGFSFGTDFSAPGEKIDCVRTASRTRRLHSLQPGRWIEARCVVRGMEAVETFSLGNTVLWERNIQIKAAYDRPGLTIFRVEEDNVFHVDDVVIRKLED